VIRVGVIAVACTAVVGAIAGLQAGRRSMAVVARGGSGHVHRSRLASTVLRASSRPRTTLVLGLKDVASRRGRAIVTVLTVAFAVTITMAVVAAAAATELEAIVHTGSPDAATVTEIPADPSDIPNLPVFSSTFSDEARNDASSDLVSTMQVLVIGVAVLTLLAAAAMTLRERSRELSTLHALGCTPAQLAGASSISQGFLGLIGALLGIPIGLELFSALSSSRVEASAPPGQVAAIAIAAVAIAAIAAAIPALVLQRRSTSQALAAETT
jgi:putative ABC transport system permease protein